MSNARLKLAKSQAKAKQHPEAELFLFENYSLSSSTLSSKNNRFSKKMHKKKERLFKTGCTMKMRLEMKRQIHINRPRPRDGHKYKYNDGYICQAIPKQHLKFNSLKSEATLTLS